MRPTCPAPEPDQRPGFTLIEIVVALAICTITIYACASALLTSLRAEGTARDAMTLDLALDRLATAHYVRFDIDAPAIEVETTLEETTFAGLEWSVMRVAPPAGGMAGVLAFRKRASPSTRP
jgi:prepilin-type N-terminal cleavage/methylation domain-containing protein